jgi:hypothetical protein
LAGERGVAASDVAESTSVLQLDQGVVADRSAVATLAAPAQATKPLEIGGMTTSSRALPGQVRKIIRPVGLSRIAIRYTI